MLVKVTTIVDNQKRQVRQLGNYRSGFIILMRFVDRWKECAMHWLRMLVYSNHITSCN